MAEALHQGSDPRRVLIAGGGMAAIEAVLALRDLLPRPVTIELLSPSSEFVYVPDAVLEPFAPGSMPRYRLDEVLAGLDMVWREESLVGADPERRLVTTEVGGEITYDLCLICVGARAEHAVPGALTFRPQQAQEMTEVLEELDRGLVRSAAFIVPPGVAWSLPAYELALLSRHRVRAHGRDVELAVITPESAPLQVFGEAASAAVGRLLDDSSVSFVGDARAERFEEGAVAIADGHRADAERAVALPRLVGPALGGLPHDEEGFIPVDDHCQVTGIEDVWAAGDATSFPLKQGGLATQQADAAAQAIAARLGAAIEPDPFDPVLRGALIAEERTEYLRSAIQGGVVAPSASPSPLWVPAAKVAGRYLAPHLQRLDRQRH